MAAPVVTPGAITLLRDGAALVSRGDATQAEWVEWGVRVEWFLLDYDSAVSARKEANVSDPDATLVARLRVVLPDVTDHQFWTVIDIVKDYARQLREARDADNHGRTP